MSGSWLGPGASSLATVPVVLNATARPEATNGRLIRNEGAVKNHSEFREGKLDPKVAAAALNALDLDTAPVGGAD